MSRIRISQLENDVGVMKNHINNVQVNIYQMQVKTNEMEVKMQGVVNFVCITYIFFGLRSSQVTGTIQ